MSTPTLDRIAAILKKDPDITSAEISRILGLSRQRISAVCRENGIVLTRAYKSPDPEVRRYKPPVPTVITGGVPCALSNTVCGSISELLAAADLLARGFHVYAPIVQHKGFDLLAVNKLGEILSFEVRSGRKKTNGSIGYNKKVESAADYYAIVITGEPVRYEPELPTSDPMSKRYG